MFVFIHNGVNNVRSKPINYRKLNKIEESVYLFGVQF